MNLMRYTYLKDEMESYGRNWVCATLDFRGLTFFLIYAFNNSSSLRSLNMGNRAI